MSDFMNRIPDCVNVVFRNKINKSSVSLRLYSKFTCIYGDCSSEGKTAFFEFLHSGLHTTHQLEVVSDYNFILYGFSDTVITRMFDGSRNVIMIDEVAMLSEDLLSKVMSDSNLYIGVTHGMPAKFYYPLCGIYKLDFLAGETYDVSQSWLLSVARDFSKQFKVIVVESGKGRSEHELLYQYLGDSVIASCGAGCVERYLRGTSSNILVLADLGNIGQELGILRTRQLQNPGIRFYDYACFEELLYFSDLVKNRFFSKKSFDYFSLESFYEHALEAVTQGAYKHGKPLDSVFLDKSNFEAIFNTDVGRGLYEYIKRYGDLS